MGVMFFIVKNNNNRQVNVFNAIFFLSFPIGESNPQNAENATVHINPE